MKRKSLRQATAAESAFQARYQQFSESTSGLSALNMCRAWAGAFRFGLPQTTVTWPPQNGAGLNECMPAELEGGPFMLDPIPGVDLDPYRRLAVVLRQRFRGEVRVILRHRATPQTVPPVSPTAGPVPRVTFFLRSFTFTPNGEAGPGGQSQEELGKLLWRIGAETYARTLQDALELEIQELPSNGGLRLEGKCRDGRSADVRFDYHQFTWRLGLE